MSQIVGFFFKTSWKQIIIAAISSSAVAGLNIMAIRYMSQIVGVEDANKLLLFGQVALLLSVSTIIGLFSGRYITKYYERLVSNYRHDLARFILMTKYEKVEEKLERIVTLLLFEISTIGNFGKNISGVMVAIFQIVVVIVMMMLLSWKLTLVVAIIFLVTGIVNVVTLPWFKQIENLISKVRFKLHYNLDRFEKGLKDLNLNRKHGQEYISRALDSHSRDMADMNVSVFYRRTLIESFSSLFALLAFGATLVYSLLFLNFTTEKLVEFLALVLFVNPSFGKVTSFFKDLKVVENALDQIQSFDIDISKGIDNKEPENIVPNKGSEFIKIQELRYQYPGSAGFSLGPVSFSIQENTITIIKGGNGSGKSTLFKVMTGLYEPTSGSISYHGNKLEKNNLRSFQSDVSCAYTDSPVFEDLKYIQNSNLEFNGKEMISYLELTSKTAFDSDMQIEQIHLSQGQRGRLNLMRVLMEDKPICMFDEWAANQDVEFRRKFYTEIIPHLKKLGKTIIMISHDEKYYDIADQLITLKEGKAIVET